MVPDGIKLSDNFMEALEMPSCDLAKHIDDKGTERYEAFCNGRKIYGARLTVLQAAGIARAFAFNGENIIKACSLSPKVVFTSNNIIAPDDKMRIEVKGSKASIALNTKVISESLVRSFSPKMEEWFSAVDRSEESQIESFDREVDFSTDVAYARVTYSGDSYMILLDADTKRIWAFKNGYTRNITDPGFTGALQKLHFMSTIV